MWKKENLRENAYGGPLAVRTVGGSRKMSCQGSGISLDSIASSRELPGNCLGGIPERPPLTPRRINMKKIVVSPTKPMVNLWEHIPSSPPAPPSSPSADSLRFATLPTHSKKTRSLEWACAKARAERNPKDQDADNDFDVPMLILDGAAKHPDTDAGGDDTETEEYEAITPDVSAVQLTTPQSPVGVHMKNEVHPAEDVEAAIALLGFMSKRS